VSKRDELAAALADLVDCGDRYCGTLGGESRRKVCVDCRGCRDRAADAVLAWLGEQFDEGLHEHVEAKVDEVRNGCPRDFHDASSDEVADAALAVARARLVGGAE